MSGHCYIILFMGNIINFTTLTTSTELNYGLIYYITDLYYHILLTNFSQLIYKNNLIFHYYVCQNSDLINFKSLIINIGVVLSAYIYSELNMKCAE